jgi:acyl-coenzyme A synthetase/AMP-(fatty) acid ligase
LDIPDNEIEALLRSKLRSELPNFMQPRHVLICDELPRNPNGKLDRVAITADALKEFARDT